MVCFKYKYRLLSVVVVIFDWTFCVWFEIIWNVIWLQSAQVVILRLCFFYPQQGVPLSFSPNFDLRAHIESLGHNVACCLGVRLLPRRCGGFLTKRGGRVKTWRRRWFLFDLDHRRLAYYTGKSCLSVCVYRCVCRGWVEGSQCFCISIFVCLLLYLIQPLTVFSLSLSLFQTKMRRN